jgi:hypothetical protein
MKTGSSAAREGGRPAVIDTASETMSNARLAPRDTTSAAIIFHPGMQRVTPRRSHRARAKAFAA